MPGRYAGNYYEQLKANGGVSLYKEAVEELKKALQDNK